MAIPFANIFQPLIDVFEVLLVFLHDSVGLGWGLSIIAMTVIIRALLIPLTLKQFRSMQAMQRLQPQIKELQAKYKDDRQRQQQAMMTFYQENKVNPFGSCLPLLLQMPVFLALFYLLREDLRDDICGQSAKVCSQIATSGGAEKFLFIPDLTDRATGGVLAVLLVLYVGSQLLSSLLMSVTVDRNQRLLMLGLPFVFVFFIQSFPAGLLVYWITTNLWTVGQQYVVRRTVGPVVPVVAAESGKAGGAGAKVGGKSNGKPAAVAADAFGAGDEGDGKRAGAGGLFGALAARAQAVQEDKDSRKAEPVAAAAAARPSGPPPRSPRKKKKRSGRRR